MVVDYLGAALTLAGCTLLLLPLIWVRILTEKMSICAYLVTMAD